MRTTVLTIALLLVTFQMTYAQQPQVGYVARVTGKATARLGSATARPLRRFSPVYLNDIVTLDHGAVVLVRFDYGERKITDATPSASRKIVPPPPPANDENTRVLRAVFDSQRRTFNKASQNVPTGTRDILAPQPLEAMLPRKKTLAQGLRFQWTRTTQGPVSIGLYDQSGKSIWFQSDIQAEYIDYPPTAPHLKPGVAYRWKITAKDINSSAEATFEIATLPIARYMQTQFAMLNTVSFADDQERRLARASLLMDHELYTNAAEELEQMPPSEVSPMVHAVLAIAWKEMAKNNADSDTDKTPIRQEQLNKNSIQDRHDPLFEEWRTGSEPNSSAEPPVTTAHSG